MLKYIFLGLSVIEFAVGFSDWQDNSFFYLGRPLGAIFFGLFLIVTVLEKESALFDQEHKTVSPPQSKTVVAPPETADPGLAPAHSH